MMASSTSAPTAMAIPPSVMLSIDRPARRTPTTAASSDSGIATRVIAPARRFARNSRVTSTTSSVPSRSAPFRFASASSMKSACRNRRESSCIPTGNSDWMASSTRSRSAVNASVLTSGCRWMPRITAGCPLREPSPRLSASPIRTVATSRTRIGRVSRVAMTVAPMPSTSCARPAPWIRYSCPPARRNPADVLRLARCRAGLHRAQRNTVAGQPPRLDQHLELPPLAADDRHLRDTRRREHPPADQRLGRRAQLQRGMRGGLQGDEHDLAHDRRQRRHHRRVDVVRQRRRHGDQPLADGLSRRGAHRRPSRSRPR